MCTIEMRFEARLKGSLYIGINIITRTIYVCVFICININTYKRFIHIYACIDVFYVCAYSCNVIKITR